MKKLAAGITITLGAGAAALVVGTLVLLACMGHPEGLMAAAAGAGIGYVVVLAVRWMYSSKR